MRILVLSADATKLIDNLDPGQLAYANGNVAWAAMTLAYGTVDPVTGSPSIVSFIDRANPGPVLGAATAVAKIEFYRRCTDTEVGQIQALLADTGPKMTAIFDACVYFRSDAPEWQMLVDATTGLFGADRAKVLLAPSE